MVELFWMPRRFVRKLGTEVLVMSEQRDKGTSTKKDVETYIINPDGSTQANPEADREYSIRSQSHLEGKTDQPTAADGLPKDRPG